MPSSMYIPDWRQTSRRSSRVRSRPSVRLAQSIEPTSTGLGTSFRVVGGRSATVLMRGRLLEVNWGCGGSSLAGVTELAAARQQVAVGGVPGELPQQLER